MDLAAGAGRDAIARGPSVANDMSRTPSIRMQGGRLNMVKTRDGRGTRQTINDIVPMQRGRIPRRPKGGRCPGPFARFFDVYQMGKRTPPSQG